MFGQYYYHRRIRNSVALFGKLFNDIYILRQNAAGETLSTIKVPLSYAPKRKYMERLTENADLINDTKVAIKLPRMSFEITSFDYDPSRQLQKVNAVNRVGVQPNQRTKIFSPVPYNITFQVNIYAKTQDDALQVVEQIVPYFSPQYTMTVRPLVDYPQITEDIPITMRGVTFSDDYEGSIESRRTIIYTLDFEMKINFYGPTNESPIIRQADVDLYNITAAIGDSDQFVEKIRVVPNPFNAGPDSDYGFTTTLFTALDSA